MIIGLSGAFSIFGLILVATFLSRRKKRLQLEEVNVMVMLAPDHCCYDSRRRQLIYQHIIHEKVVPQKKVDVNDDIEEVGHTSSTSITSNITGTFTGVTSRAGTGTGTGTCIDTVAGIGTYTSSGEEGLHLPHAKVLSLRSLATSGMMKANANANDDANDDDDDDCAHSDSNSNSIHNMNDMGTGPDEIDDIVRETLQSIRSDLKIMRPIGATGNIDIDIATGDIDIDIDGDNDIDGDGDGDPVRVYSLKNCPICCETYVNGDDVAWSRNEHCWHAYHTDCILEWLLKHDDCPICRNGFGLDQDGIMIEP